MTVPQKAIATTPGEIMESVIIKGDLSKLEPGERATYYKAVCDSIGINPLTKPFDYITLNGKLTLYALRGAADQLRKVNGISIAIVSQDQADGLLSVHVRAKDKTGREDEDLGVVAFPETLKGEARANAILKAVTKAKRRVTLSISGLGFLDETEVEDIPASAKRPSKPAPNVMLPAPEPHDPETGEIIDAESASLQPSTSPQFPGAAAGQAAPSSVPQQDGGAADVPTPEAYVAKWHTLVDNASNRAQADQMAKLWNDEKPLRNRITWPEDDTFARLQTKVKGAIEMLREPA